MSDEKFICSNNRFKTNIKKGFKGSVTKTPFYKNATSVLRLEHVIEIKAPKKEWYWFMWYHSDGKQMLDESAVFDKYDILKIIKNIKDIDL